jgi:hypothetical protein
MRKLKLLADGESLLSLWRLVAESRRSRPMDVGQVSGQVLPFSRSPMKRECARSQERLALVAIRYAADAPCGSWEFAVRDTSS